VTSKRLLAAVAVLLLPAAFVACGDEDDAADGATSPETNGSPSADSSPGAAFTPTPTPRPETALATPTPIPEGSPLVSIVAGGTALAPTASDFTAWPQTTVSVDGTEYTGVTLSAVAEAAGASGAYFEIEGVRSDGVRYAIARHPLADLGDTSLLVLTDSGQLNFVSSSLDPAQWMSAVSAISFV
jgi:hypothetical protein